MSDEKKPLGIVEAISRVMAEVKPVGKEGENKSQHYRFRKVDDVYDALSPVLAKHGVVIVPEVLGMERIEGLDRNAQHVFITIQYTWHCTADDSELVSVVVGQGHDSLDKAVNKAFSAAYKLNAFQMLSIPCGDAIDSEDDRHDAPTPQKYDSSGDTRAISDKQWSMLRAKHKAADIPTKDFEKLIVATIKREIQSEDEIQRCEVDPIVAAIKSWTPTDEPTEPDMPTVDDADDLPF